MLLYLIGLPGSGKTTLGRQIAQFLSYDFVDLDAMIEESQQQSIKNIFEEKGEVFFRELEKNTLHKTFQFDNKVIATGGGTPCFFDNLAQINSSGTSVYIKVSAEEISKRLTGGRDVRPLVKGKSAEELLQYIKELELLRSTFYNQSTVIVEGDNIQAKELLDMIRS